MLVNQPMAGNPVIHNKNYKEYAITKIDGEILIGQSLCFLMFRSLMMGSCSKVAKAHPPVPWVFITPGPEVTVMFFVRGVVTPTWALMPRLHEPVCETAPPLFSDPPLSDSSDTSEGFGRHFEPDSIFTLLSKPPSDFLTSSQDQLEFCSTTECFSASVFGYKCIINKKIKYEQPVII